VRVATWNLSHGLDMRTGRIDLGAVAAAVDALDVAVLAVQEVDREQRRTGRVDQVADLAGRLGLHGVFAPALLGEPARRWHPDQGDGTDPGGPASGIGLLSRHPLLRSERTALRGGGAGERRPEDVGRALPGWDHEPRAVLRAQVVPPGGRPLVVATAHLSYLVWRGVRQLHHAASWTAACGLPAVLIGDLNLPLRLLRPHLPDPAGSRRPPPPRSRRGDRACSSTICSAAAHCYAMCGWVRVDRATTCRSPPRSSPHESSRLTSLSRTSNTNRPSCPR
jgi:endonuclease/exonuclease/phosphatase family metal-dependent hydrolase